MSRLCKLFASILWGALTGLAAPGAAASAQEVVVELYTAQGCSACPPADKLFAELAERDGIIALALHVDYWDYIGWSDSFAQPEFTKRQKDYARAAGTTRVYTPHMIVDGQDHLRGAQAMPVLDAIRRHRERPRAVELQLDRNADGTLQIRARWQGDAAGATDVQLVRYMPERTVQITAGENAGRSITYRNVVTQWQVLTRWEGQGPLSLETGVAGEAPLVVIVQRAGHGPILAAARLR